MIASTNVGFYYEAAGPEVEHEQLKEYILKIYRAAVNGTQLDFSPNQEEIVQYTYVQKAADFEVIFSSNSG